MGGSADLAPSNLTMWSGSKSLTAEDASGNYIHYGVREFGMTAIINGIALHGGFVPYGATFLMFMEYARNAMRMAALMKVQNIQVYTHDSIGLGEDGPTHQPVEQIASLRMTPNMSTWRYILKDCAGQPELILIATGSEVELAVAAYEQLSAEGKAVRVVSMPSTDAFDKQDAAYREAVLPAAVTKRIAIEAGIADFWYKYVGFGGRIIGMTSFGESAPAGELFKLFGFTTENVVKQAKELLA
ncbi:transketolase [Vibrio cholerae]|nr:transketolase [Vibrio cholerae]